MFPSALDPHREIVEESVNIEKEMFTSERDNKQQAWEVAMKKKLDLNDSDDEKTEARIKEENVISKNRKKKLRMRKREHKYRMANKKHKYKKHSTYLGYDDLININLKLKRIKEYKK